MSRRNTKPVSYKITRTYNKRKNEPNNDERCSKKNRNIIELNDSLNDIDEDLKNNSRAESISEASPPVPSSIKIDKMKATQTSFTSSASETSPKESIPTIIDTYPDVIDDVISSDTSPKSLHKDVQRATYNPKRRPKTNNEKSSASEFILSSFHSRNSLITASCTRSKSDKSQSKSEVSISHLLKLANKNKTDYELTKIFTSRSEYNHYMAYNFSHTRITNNENVGCSCFECKTNRYKSTGHEMTRIYRSCNCSKDSCMLKLRVYMCSLTKKIYVYQKSKHEGSLSGIKKTRGINPLVKDKIFKILKVEPDIIPSCIHNALINNFNLPTILIPKLRQVQNFVTNLRNRKLNTNSISNVLETIKGNIYSSDLEEDKPFFFNLKYNDKREIILNNGSDLAHLNIMVTTKRLMSRIDSNLNGCYHIDSTYKLTKNGFPLIVLARTDAKNKIHPIIFGLTSHEQAIDFIDFYKGAARLSKKLNIDFRPQYLMQDAAHASYNAITSLFSNTVVLMCYYHVMANCRKRYLAYSDDLKDEIKFHLRNLHMSINSETFDQNLASFKDYGQNNCSEFLEYVNDTWIIGKFNAWQIFKRPAGYSCTNSPIESFNSSIKRTFTLRRKMSVYNFVGTLLKMTSYYSKTQSTFALEPEANSQTKKFAKKYTSFEYFEQRGGDKWTFRDTDNSKFFKLNRDECVCSCKYWLKHKVCGHILALQTLFDTDDFVNKTKRGGQKKALKALQKDLEN